MSDTDKQQDPRAAEDTAAEEASIDKDPAGDETAEGETLADEVTVDRSAEDEPAPEESSGAAEEAPVPDADEAPVPDAEEAPVPKAEEAPPPKATAGRGVAWLALLVSAVAIAAAAFTVFMDWRSADDDATDDTIASLERQLNESRGQFGDLDARVAELAGRDSVSTADIDALRRQLEERVDVLSTLPPRMSTLESSVASLAGISEGARETFLLAEAEYYMQIANAQLQLANNPHLASLALAMADERVVQLADPGLTDVRRAIADELAALAVMEKPDIAGTTMTLASLSRVVESLPVRSTSVADEEAPAETEEEQGGMARAWSSVKGAMSGLVKVTPPDEARLELLTPDAEYFLRNNIALQLQAARLALLRGEQAIFEQSLDDTSALLRQYFDTDSTQVAGALETLEEIRGNMFATAAPDISGSLDLLRQFQVLRENSQ